MKQGVICFSILGLDVCPRCGEMHDVWSYCGDMSDYDDFYDPMLTEVTDVGDDFIDFNDSADDSNTSSSDDDTSDDDSNTSYWFCEDVFFNCSFFFYWKKSRVVD